MDRKFRHDSFCSSRASGLWTGRNSRSREKDGASTCAGSWHKSAADIAATAAAGDADSYNSGLSCSGVGGDGPPPAATATDDSSANAGNPRIFDWIPIADKYLVFQ